MGRSAAEPDELGYCFDFTLGKASGRLIGQAVGEEARKEEVDAKKTLCLEEYEGIFLFRSDV